MSIVMRLPHPDGIFIELDCVRVHPSEHHGGELAVADGQGFPRPGRGRGVVEGLEGTGICVENASGSEAQNAGTAA